MEGNHKPLFVNSFKEWEVSNTNFSWIKA